MMYVFIPYYNEDTIEFASSMNEQTVPFRVIKRDRKRDKIYWTKAVNDFRKESLRWLGVKDSDVICVMNNDIEFNENLFREGSRVKQGEVYIPRGNGVYIIWKLKAFCNWVGRIDGFYGRCFFMTVGDFKKFTFCKLLPHYLSDLDYSLRVLKKLTPVLMETEIYHKNHERNEGRFILNSGNPIFWTIFLLRHPNRYTLINILKAWLWWV